METFSDRTVVYENAPPGAGVTAGAVSWGAILGGAVAAAAMSMILFILGTGLGLTSISPWSNEGIDAGTFGMAAILWITFTSLASAALGGYLAGRLRTRWLDVPTDEVYFRDTTHGFLAWAVATLLTATLFAAAAVSTVNTGARAGASVAAGVGGAVAGAVGSGVEALQNADDNTLSYYLDSLFRRDPSAVAQQPAPPPPVQTDDEDEAQGGNAANAGVANGDNQAVQAPSVQEVSRIFVRALRQDGLPEEDLDYIGQLVAAYTDIDAQEAERRVTEAYENMTRELQELQTTAQEVADEARAAMAYISLWCFVALLAGAFVGSLSATWGGRQRDL